MVRRLAALLFAIALPLAPRPAAAYCRTTTIAAPPDFDPAQGCFSQGAPLYWSTTCTGYVIGRGASRQVDYATTARVLLDAFRAWTGPVCASGESPSINVVHLGPTDSTKVEYITGGPNENVIVYRDDAWPHPGSEETLALTTLTFHVEAPDPGRIVDADMEVNSAQNTFAVGPDIPPDSIDLRTVFNHDAGHFLGFAHSADSNAAMFPRAFPGTPHKDLSADDTAAVCAAYPPDATRPTASGILPAEACALAPASGSGGPCAPTVSRACAVGGRPSDFGAGLVALGLVALVRRRVGRRDAIRAVRA